MHFDDPLQKSPLSQPRLTINVEDGSMILLDPLPFATAGLVGTPFGSKAFLILTSPY